MDIPNIARLLELQSGKASSPIKKLPNALLITILAMATTGRVEGADASDYIEISQAPNRQSLTNVITVCRHWRDIVLDCPLFWTTISFSSPPPWNFIQLKRVKGAPLSLIRLGLDTSLSSWDLFNSTLYQRSHQIREVMLEFDIVQKDKVFASLELIDTPILESLQLLCYFDPPTSDFPLFQKRIPSLRRLYLWDIIMPWNSPQLVTNLTHLSIWFGDYDPHPRPILLYPTLSQLLEFLKAAVSLQSLVLCEAIPSAFETQVSSYESIYLNHLTHLELHHRHLAASVQLLLYLTLQQSTYIHLFTKPQRFADATMQAASRAIPPSHFQPHESRLLVKVGPRLDVYLHSFEKLVWQLTVVFERNEELYGQTLPLIAASVAAYFSTLHYFEISVDLVDVITYVEIEDGYWQLACWNMKEFFQLCIKTKYAHSSVSVANLLIALASSPVSLSLGQEP